MINNLDAVFENGAFRPVGDSEISLSNGDRVRLIVEPIHQDAELDVLKLAAKVYTGLSDEDISEIEKIALDRTTFFSR